MKKYLVPAILIGVLAMVFLNACDKVKPPYTNTLPIISSKYKRVLCEEGTGVWCGYCVRGICAMNDMKNAHPDNWIGIAVHSGDSPDPMVVTNYDAYLKTIFQDQYPNGLIDRTTVKDPSDFESAYLTAVTKVPLVDMSIKNIQWNNLSRSLSYTIQAIVLVNFNGDYRFNSVITEDSVHGTTAAWNQTNYYANNAQGKMCGFDTLPNPVPAASMYYNHVARYLFDGWDGIQGSIKTNVNHLVGDTITYDFVYPTALPAGWNASHINVIGFVIKHDDGTIVNACQAEHVGK